MSTVGKETTKVQVFMKNNLLERLDKYAESLGISRSSAVNVCVNEYLQQRDTMQTMQDLMTEYKKQFNGLSELNEIKSLMEENKND